jgi:ribosomal-protein-alanine N-acetyltransferase
LTAKKREKRKARGLTQAVALGEEVFLRSLTARDRPEFLELMRASRRLHSPWVSPPIDDAGYSSYLKKARRADFKALLVCRVEDGRILGVFNISQIVGGLFQNAYLGYYVGAPFAGKGYMTQGLRLVLGYAFTKLKLHRLEANIQPGNTFSIKLVKRCGFQLEGFSPRYLKIAGRWRDHERWAITKEVWRASLRSA